jgi:hypothetical protein
MYPFKRLILKDLAAKDTEKKDLGGGAVAVSLQALCCDAKSAPPVEMTHL